jgi:hypothetical protein
MPPESNGQLALIRDPLIQAISKIFILFFSRLLLVKIKSLRQVDPNEE